SGKTLKQVSREFLDTHNAYRRDHQAPPLTFNSDLNASAQKWADHLLSTRKLEHSRAKDGENIFYASSSGPIKMTGKEAVDSWYSEVKDYDWDSPGYSHKTGHFTQVVWKETKELGVGLATDGNTVYVVAQYRPRGNDRDHNAHKRNVLHTYWTHSVQNVP
uniref:Im:7150988 n=1 Tax=Myripristis murdjan TaxID=586833 RepID=A0A667ZNB0_9TELE